MLAGYIHESIQIFKAVGERHSTMDSFVTLRKIAHNVEYQKAREYVHEIRNVAAFHLGEYKERDNTRRSLDDLELGTFTLMGGDDPNDPMTYYFELTDYLDYSLIGRTFQSGRSPSETADDIQKTVLDLAGEIMTGSYAFLTALAKRMELQEYVYGTMKEKVEPVAESTVLSSGHPSSTGSF